MFNARKTYNRVLAVLCLIAAFSPVSEIQAASGGVQECTVSESCTVGEFLYNDEYQPLTSGTCAITSRYPNESLFLDVSLGNSTMTPSSANDGWYSKTFTAPTTVGLYRTQVCCTVSGELMCIDKSFEVKAVQTATVDTSSIASAVWGYSTRTVASISSFGSLVSDVWNNATRNLTKSDLDSGGNLATKSNVDAITNNNADITAIKKTVDESRLLLEKVANKPIIQNVLEEEVPDLSAKLQETRAVANQVYVNNQYLINKTGSVAAKWNSLTGKDLLSEVIAINAILGEPGDSSTTNSMFGQINWTRDAWSWDESESVYVSLTSASKKLAAVQESLGTYQKTNYALLEVKSALKDLMASEKLVGVSTDSVKNGNLYARIRNTENLVASLDQRQKDVDTLLAGLGKTQDIKGYSTKVNDIQQQLIAINRVPKATSFISKITSLDLKSVKNSLLSLEGVIKTNKLLLAKRAGSTLMNTWLEEGSVVFKTLVTNPSTLIAQKVEVKYYLPPEVKEEDIISADEGLTVTYDAEKGQLLVSGEFNLAKGETRTFSVKVDDIFVVSSQDVESLRAQAEELAKPLDKTSYFAQGVSLKSDINASLDKILSLQEAAVTPEQKIRAYREALIEKDAVIKKIDGLKELVNQAGSSGTLFGFVGGTQAIAVWGLIIVMAAGFVFLTLYLRTISRADGKKGKLALVEASGKSTDKKISMATVKKIEPGKSIFKYLLPLIISGIISAIVTGVVTQKVISKIYESKMEVLGESTQAQEEDLQTQIAPLEPKTEDLGIGGLDMVKILVTGNEVVGIYQEPALDSKVITSLGLSVHAVRLETKGKWVRVLLENNLTGESTIEGWVSQAFVEGKDEIQKAQEELVGAKVTISKTPTGWLRVRTAPKGTEITKVYEGESFALLDQVEGWYQIQLEDGTSGWVSQEYAQTELPEAN
jgi:hypothetical protein